MSQFAKNIKKVKCIFYSTRANQASVKRLVPRLIEHIKSGVLNPKGIITHRVPLEEVADAYHMFSAKLDDCIKPVLIPPLANA